MDSVSGAADAAVCLRGDPLIGPFLDPLFDADAYVRAILRESLESSLETGQSTAAEQALEAVQRGIGTIDEAVKSLVYANQGQLISHAKQTSGLAERMGTLNARVKSLQAITNRARSDILSPADALASDAAALERAIEASKAVRSCAQLHTVMRKAQLLFDMVSGPTPATVVQAQAQAMATEQGDVTAPAIAQTGSLFPSGPSPTSLLVPSADTRLLARLSPLIREALTVLEDARLRGVHLVEGYRQPVAGMVVAVRAAAEAHLTRALDSLDASDVGAACAVFHDLQCLPAEAAAALDRIVALASAQVKAALDVGELAAAAAAASPVSIPSTSLGSMPPPGATALWRGVLWGRIETSLEAVYKCLVQAWTLVHVLSRRKEARGAHSGLHSTAAPLMFDIATAYARSDMSSAGDGLQVQVQAQRVHHRAAVGMTQGETIPPHASDSLLPGEGEVKGNKDSIQSNAGVRLMRRAWVGVLAALRGHLEACVSLSIVVAGGGVSSGERSAGVGMAATLASTLVSLMRDGSDRSAPPPISAHAHSSQANFVRLVLEEGYPRLHYLLADAVDRTGRSVAMRCGPEEMLGPGQSAGDPANPTAAQAGVHGCALRAMQPRLGGAALFAAACGAERLGWATGPLRDAYLARCTARLTGALSAMFPAPMLQQAADRRAGAKRPAGQQVTGGTAHPSAAPSAAGLALLAAGFTAADELDRYSDEGAYDMPSSTATLAFVRLCTLELAACKPALAHCQPDMTLFEAVAARVSSALSMLVSHASTIAARGPSIYAVAEHWGPAPSQVANLSLACRLDEVRLGLVGAAADLPLWPPPLHRLLEVPLSDPAVVSASRARRDAHPLCTPLPPHLLLIGMAAGRGAGKSGSALVPSSHCAHATLLLSLGPIDAMIEALILPWMNAVCTPLMRTVSRVADGLYTSGADSSSTPLLAVPAGETEWAVALDTFCRGLVARQLTPLLPQAAQKQGAAGRMSTCSDSVRTGLAFRVVRHFLRTAACIRPMDESGRGRLARDCAQVESSLASLLSGSSSGNMEPGQGSWTGCKAELRAFRSLLFSSTEPDISRALHRLTAEADRPKNAKDGGVDTDAADAEAACVQLAGLLSSLPPSLTLHAIAARLPRTVYDLPHTKAKVDIRGYVAWLDAVAAAALEQQNARGGACTPHSPAVHALLVSFFPPKDALAVVDAAAWNRLEECLLEVESRPGAGGSSSGSGRPAEHDVLRAYGSRLINRLYR